MPNQKILPIIYWVSMLSIGPALIAKSTNLGSPLMWLEICLITQIFFAIGAIAEIRNSQYLSEEQKSKWRRWLVWSPLFYGFFYLKHFRK